MKDKKSRSDIQVTTKILSDDLLHQLRGREGEKNDEEDKDISAGDTDSSLIVGGKRQRQRSSTDELKPSKMIEETAVKMSKASRKRELQILRRKESEKKRDSFIETIHANVITEQERDLLTSSKQIGHGSSLSLKHLLSRLLKRKRAGLELSAEETDLLYSQGSTRIHDSDIYQPMITEIAVECVQAEADRKTEIETNTDQLFLTCLPTISSNDAQIKPKKKRKKSSKEDGDNDHAVNTETISSEYLFSSKSVESIEQPARGDGNHPSILKQSIVVADAVKSSETVRKEEKSAGSVGLSLLQQLKNLASKSSLSTSEKDVAKQSSLSSIDDSAATTDDTVVEKVYIPEETAIPVSASGSIIVLPQHEKSSEVTTAPRPSAKRSVFVERPDDVALSRMNLPICSMEQEIVEAIQAHDVVILCGETGSGKSTQVPQFLYEASFSEAGRKMIGITQPRRVAVTSTAQRVRYEMGSAGGCVGYQVRFDSVNIGPSTCIKYMTDGILLKEISHQLLLPDYSVIILDEAHERNINTDVLLGMLSRAITVRKSQSAEEMRRWVKLSDAQKALYEPPIQPLKLVIMSATLRVEDFQTERLFLTPPPVIQVDARQYPVVTHFSKRTEVKNYLRETHKKVVQIHKRLPDGTILVFLTGKREILYMCQKLTKSLNKKRKAVAAEASVIDSSDADDAGDGNRVDSDFFHGEGDEGDSDGGEKFEDQEGVDSDSSGDEDDDDEDDDHVDSQDGDEKDSDGQSDEGSLAQRNRLARRETPQHREGGSVVAKDADSEDYVALRSRMLKEALGSTATTADDATPTAASNQDPTQLQPDVEPEPDPEPMRALVLPLYAMMPTERQQMVFEPPPPGYRLIIVATNVAETSLTIPGVRYVVDSGREKVREYGDPQSGTGGVRSGIARYSVQWISQASADQRQGRAGRTGPGHCYRLFSSAFFHQHMKLFRPPEICSAPLEDLVLQMRAIGIERVESFPFPTAPPLTSLRAAVSLLTYLGAMHCASRNAERKKSSETSSTALLRKLDSQLSGKGYLTLQMVEDGGLTELGALLVRFPINPRFAKMLVLAHRADTQVDTHSPSLPLLAYTLTLVSALTEPNLFQRVGGNESVAKISSDDEDDDDDDGDDDEDRHNKAISLEEKQRQQKQLYYHADGDALARLHAVGAYLYVCQKSGSSTSAASSAEQQLCSSQGLSLPALKKIAELRRQLQRICQNVFRPLSGSDHPDLGCLNPPINPPTKQQESALRQILLAGYCDSVARRAPLSRLRSLLSAEQQQRLLGSRRKRCTAYLSCHPFLSQQPLYIHPNSNLYRADPLAQLPEFIVYGDLVQNSKGDAVYMATVTTLSMAAKWIPEQAGDCPLLKWGAALTSPAPFYDATKDKVMCYAVPKFGVHNWELSPTQRPLLDHTATHTSLEAADSKDAKGGSPNLVVGFRREDEAFRWFGRLLLEGAVPVGLTGGGLLRKENLKQTPAALTQMKPAPMVTELLRALVSEGVCSLSTLRAALRRAPTYLSDQLQAFLRGPDLKKSFRVTWAALAASSDNRDNRKPTIT